MITLHESIFSLNPSIVIIRGDVAYDKDEQEVAYDKDAAQAKLVELEAKEIAKEQTQATAKVLALAKLTALGLTIDDLTALGITS
jgi:hypothetical protein